MMQEIHFETTIKNGYIKIPEIYSRLNDKKVVVDIFNKDIAGEEKENRENRMKNVNEFLRKCSGILKNTRIPSDISIKKSRAMRLNEKYGL